SSRFQGRRPVQHPDSKRCQWFATVLAVGLVWTAALAAGTTEPTAASAAGPNGPLQATSPARVRLLSQEQYFNTLEYIFGPDISVAAHFAPFRRTEGLLASGSASAG